MPFNFIPLDCSPLVIDQEYEVSDEDLLAEYVGTVVLGHYAHIKRIIGALSITPIDIPNQEINAAIKKMQSKGKTTIGIEKRDGWIFQIISWLALLEEHNGKDFHCQQPHDATAQHGLDGIAILLDNNLKLKSIIITEDKCTTKHRSIIPQVWKEFREFEKGDHNNKMVSRISALLEPIDNGKVLEKNKNDIYNKAIRNYRVGISRTDYYTSPKGRMALFKGYDTCIKGKKPHRRFASTMLQNDIRAWMEQFSLKVIQYLKSQKV